MADDDNDWHGDERDDRAMINKSIYKAIKKER